MKRILNLIWLFTLLMVMALVLEAGVLAASSDEGNESVYATGLLWDSWEEIEKYLREDPPQAFESELPPSVSLKDTFPAPGNQGRQQSCVPWAVAYALKSHQEQLKKDWGLHTDEHLFSPAYLYNQINFGADGGSNLIIAMNTLAEQGVSTLASFPYDESDYLTQPTEAQRAEAAYFRTADFYAISGRDSIKRRLADGDGVVICLKIFPDFNGLSPSNPIFDVVTGTAMGDHAICLIGYDDEKDAFHFINSWGTEWGLDGYGWISYDLLDDIRVNSYGAAVGYVMESYDAIGFEDSFEYTVSDGEATIARYLGAGGDITIPGTLGGYPVTGIGDRVFQNNAALTGVVFPDSVAVIGSYAFERCASLTSVSLGNGVTAIGSNAFQRCTALTDVVIGNSEMTIASGAFFGCQALTGFTVHEDNPSYAAAEGVLFDKSLTRLVLCPAGKVGAYTIPDRVTMVHDNAFNGCASLTEVVIGSGVAEISFNMFSDCWSLASVVIPDNVTAIAPYAFYSCSSLSGITIPDSVITIGNDAFVNCAALTSVIIPDSVISIGVAAFGDCTALTDVYIGSNVTFIGAHAFHYISAFGWPHPLPDLTIRCYENSYTHDYAVTNGLSFLFRTEPETTTIEVSPLPNDGNIIVNHITVTRTANGLHDLAVDFEKAGEVFFILAEYDGDVLVKAYLGDSDAAIKGIAAWDFTKSKIFIWDKDMQPCVEAITKIAHAESP